MKSVNENFKSESKIKVWDIYTRIFHILLIFSIIGTLLTSLKENLLFYHIWFGESIIALVIFRIGWGWLGNHFSKFENFIVGIRKTNSYLNSYLKFSPQRSIGHNPLAAIVIVFLLAFLLMITISGLIVLGGEEQIGYLSNYITIPVGFAAKVVHLWLTIFLGGLVFVHLIGVLLGSILHKENLIYSIITGNKKANLGVEINNKKSNINLRIIFIFAIMCFVASIPYLNPLNFNSPTTIKAALNHEDKDSKIYRQECGDCHFDFHPSLLPKKSWLKIMANLDDHFGEDATVSKKTSDDITKYLIQNSAEQIVTEVSYKLLNSIKNNNVPMRISTNAYIKAKHSELSDEIFEKKSVKSRLNCNACHQFAEYGSFEDIDINLP